MLWTGIIMVIALLSGYIWGKRDGMISVNHQSLVNVPLLLRQQSLEKGYCILCHEPKKKRIIHKINGQKGRRI
ncbi:MULTISPECIES: hypothetical protein [Pelosinus]|jgi:hypothetical protein|uniref:Uncharacterized protein n=1 Tax=Pelosinus fermentans B4 TaxID=1149862 RepID=I9B0A3_9FIRM|nr:MULTISPECIES: hypothetical protein [Pelosinus]EIW18582.1 hypothetical protein FB4_3402 [Pelosinus fermentans B4]EIW24361.1 hypothetical protein FA11_3403 [Pelosinus fermentans A11]OAM94346.1 hypothetical protein FR7_02364 [Pelosinus fermentans DSM 17108]SDR06732.1 hypothetical protein SAMN04515679_2468 [Pelosinus fermentans]